MWVLRITSCFVIGEIKFGRCCAIRQTVKLKSLPNFPAIQYFLALPSLCVFHLAIPPSDSLMDQTDGLSSHVQPTRTQVPGTYVLFTVCVSMHVRVRHSLTWSLWYTGVDSFDRTRVSGLLK